MRQQVNASTTIHGSIIGGQFGVCPVGQFGKRHIPIGQHLKDRFANRVELPFRYARRSGSPSTWSSTNNPFFRHWLSFELPLIAPFIAYEAIEFQRLAAKLLKSLDCCINLRRKGVPKNRASSRYLQAYSQSCCPLHSTPEEGSTEFDSRASAYVEFKLSVDSRRLGFGRACQDPVSLPAALGRSHGHEFFFLVSDSDGTGGCGLAPQEPVEVCLKEETFRAKMPDTDKLNVAPDRRNDILFRMRHIFVAQRRNDQVETTNSCAQLL